MKRLCYIVTIVLAIAATSCKGISHKKSAAPIMPASVDSMSYAYGLEIGRMLMDVDSALNVDLVCMGIKDTYTMTPKLTTEEARYAVLKYMYYDDYDRIKSYENKFLEQKRAEDKDYHATRSGLTYKMAKVGDTQRGPRAQRDTLRIMYRILDQVRIVDTTYYRNDTLRIAYGDLPKGVQEAARLAGRGGHIEVWVPSTLAYGSAGCDSLGIKPNTMLYYELKVIDVENK